MLVASLLARMETLGVYSVSFRGARKIHEEKASAVHSLKTAYKWTPNGRKTKCGLRRPDCSAGNLRNIYRSVSEPVNGGDAKEGLGRGTRQPKGCARPRWTRSNSFTVWQEFYLLPRRLSWIFASRHPKDLDMESAQAIWCGRIWPCNIRGVVKVVVKTSDIRNATVVSDVQSPPLDEHKLPRRTEGQVGGREHCCILGKASDDHTRRSCAAPCLY